MYRHLPAAETRGAALRVAPMSVAMLVRDKVLADRTVVLTSATLELGGSFDAVAGTMGLRGEGVGFEVDPEPTVDAAGEWRVTLRIGE